MKKKKRKNKTGEVPTQSPRQLYRALMMAVIIRLATERTKDNRRILSHIKQLAADYIIDDILDGGPLPTKREVLAYVDGLVADLL